MSKQSGSRASTLAFFTLLSVTLATAGCGGNGYGGGSRNNNDTTAPTVSLQTTAATVSRTVSLSATATDDYGVTRVDFLVDGTVIGSDTSNPFGVQWDTAQLPDGAHTVVARAADAAGNTAESAAVTFQVQNALALDVALDGAAEIPSTLTAGSAHATINVNVGTGAISGTLTVAGITATAAHVHDGYAGQNGPVIVGLTESATTAGNWEFPPNAALTSAQVDELLAGGLYLNVHSADYPGGELRGQIVPANVTVALARLEGQQEVAGVVTSSSGQGGVTVDTVTGRATIHVTTRGVADATAAHLHQGVGGRDGPVLVGLNQDGSDPTHWSAVDQPLSVAALAALADGGTYLNVHTPDNPNGELRGQVTPPGVLFVAGRLGGDQEVPAKTSAGRGVVALTVDRTSREFELHANVSGVDDATAAHIHQEYAGANGPVIVPLQHDATDVTHWSAAGTFTEAQFDALEEGELYVNVHTPANPGGEIRGQLVPPGIVLVFTGLSGDQEVPPVATTAAGVAATTVYLETRTVAVNVRATGVDDATGASINGGASGSNGPPIVILAQDATTPGHWSVEDQGVTLEQLTDFLEGLWYVNVQTPAHPDGQIRGQVEPEPPPAADATAPTVSLAALPATVSGMVTLNATATDDVGVASVRFLVNGSVIGTDATAPYSMSWDTTGVANGQVMVSAEAVDTSGNVGAATAQAVTVNNVAATTLAELQATIFTPRCSGCHTGGGGGLPSSMNLSSAAASFAALVNVASVEQPAVLRVKPNDPANSYLVRKLEGDASISGVRMPQGGPFLTTAEIDKVKSWVNAGALNN